ncbi:MAG: hypothetical protein K0Q79_897 [Flavipsychrobacter sp.]|jgi:hypothetical protein|nr:hypothetical protein [Flavipsychrobacter sp.]
MDIIDQLNDLVSRYPDEWHKVNVDDTYYNWLNKIVAYAPENGFFNFRQVIEQIIADCNYDSIFLSAEESKANPEKYDAVDIFYEFYMLQLIVEDKNKEWEEVEGWYQLTDGGKEFKKAGDWFEWHKQPGAKTVPRQQNH